MGPPRGADPQPPLGILKLATPAGQGQEGEEGKSHHQWEAETSLENEVILNVQNQEPQKEAGTGLAPGKH